MANTRGPGVYMPPFRRFREDEANALKGEDSVKAEPDAAERQRQRESWEALRKAITGIVNKAAQDNIPNIAVEALRENLTRGRGLFCRQIMRAQSANPKMAPVFASLVAVINSKLPTIGDLLLSRLITQFKRTYRRRDKRETMAIVQLLAHLITQRVASVLLGLHVLVVLLCNEPTGEDIEIAVAFFREVHRFLEVEDPKAFREVMKPIRDLLNGGGLDMRLTTIVESMFSMVKEAAARKDSEPIVHPDLDLVEEEDQITHDHVLEDEHDVKQGLDVFQFDPQYDQHEEEYAAIRCAILGEDDEADALETAAALQEMQHGDDGAMVVAEEDAPPPTTTAFESNEELIQFRKKVFLILKNSMGGEEAVHKLAKAMAVGQEKDLAQMIVESCGQEKTFMKFYGSVAERLCLLNARFQSVFLDVFYENYASLDQLDTRRIRLMAQLYAHLLAADAVSWAAFRCMRLTEEDTTASQRVFIKYVFQELVAGMGTSKVTERMADPQVQPFISGLFLRDSLEHARACCNFFIEIGLDAMIDSLYEWYKEQKQAQKRPRYD